MTHDSVTLPAATVDDLWWWAEQACGALAFLRHDAYRKGGDSTGNVHYWAARGAYAQVSAIRAALPRPADAPEGSTP